MYVCYLTIYEGDKFPPYYVGSTSKEKILNGYRGSVSSKAYKELWKLEQKENPQLFNTIILSEHETRKSALEMELAIHKELDIVKNDLFVNMALASKDGMFGRDVSGENNPMFGKNHSEESLMKLKESRGHDKRYEMTERIRRIVSKTHKGKVVSDEVKEKLSKKLKGREGTFKGLHHSDETKKKISESQKGKVFSEEQRKKISIGNRGLKRTDEQRKALSELKKGIKRGPMSEEQKQKLSEKMKGRIFSDEHRKNLSKPRNASEYECPYCGFIGKGGNMKRYHFENCKRKQKEN